MAAPDAFTNRPDGRPEEIRFCGINDQVSEVAYAIPEIPSHTLAGLRLKEWRQSMRQTPIIGTDHSTNWTGTDRRLGR